MQHHHGLAHLYWCMFSTHGNEKPPESIDHAQVPGYIHKKNTVPSQHTSEVVQHTNTCTLPRNYYSFVIIQMIKTIEIYLCYPDFLLVLYVYTS